MFLIKACSPDGQIWTPAVRPPSAPSAPRPSPSVCRPFAVRFRKRRAVFGRNFFVPIFFFNPVLSSIYELQNIFCSQKSQLFSKMNWKPKKNGENNEKSVNWREIKVLYTVTSECRRTANGRTADGQFAVQIQALGGWSFWKGAEPLDPAPCPWASDPNILEPFLVSISITLLPPVEPVEH